MVRVGEQGRVIGSASSTIALTVALLGAAGATPHTGHTVANTQAAQVAAPYNQLGLTATPVAKAPPSHQAQQTSGGRHRVPAPRPRTPYAGPWPKAPAVAFGVWDELAHCETRGDWSWGSQFADPAYEGGVGFFEGTWLAYKPADYPDHAYAATRDQQILVARRILASVGPSSWGCGPKVGLEQGD